MKLKFKIIGINPRVVTAEHAWLLLAWINALI